MVLASASAILAQAAFLQGDTGRRAFHVGHVALTSSTFDLTREM